MQITEFGFPKSYLKKVKNTLNFYYKTFEKGDTEWTWVQVAKRYNVSPLDVPKFIRYCVDRGIQIGMPESKEEAQFYHSNLRKVKV